MSAMTVHRAPERVNTLYRVSPNETPGARLKAYVRARWSRKQGGDTALAKDAGIRRQTLQDWYAMKDTPSLGNLDAVARALGVRRVDLLAAYDGVTAPETETTAPPEWVERLLAGVMALENDAGISDPALAQATAKAAAHLAVAHPGRQGRGGGAGRAGSSS